MGNALVGRLAKGMIADPFEWAASEKAPVNFISRGFKCKYCTIRLKKNEANLLINNFV